MTEASVTRTQLKEGMSISQGKVFNEHRIPVAVKVLLGGLAYGIITDTSIESLLDEESHHEFQSNVKALSEFIIWFTHPNTEILKTRNHETIFRYLISVFLRAYHRNLKHRIVLKVSKDGRVVSIKQ